MTIPNDLTTTMDPKSSSIFSEIMERGDKTIGADPLEKVAPVSDVTDVPVKVASNAAQNIKAKGGEIISSIEDAFESLADVANVVTKSDIPNQDTMGSNLNLTEFSGADCGDGDCDCGDCVIQ